MGSHANQCSLTRVKVAHMHVIKRRFAFTTDTTQRNIVIRKTIDISIAIIIHVTAMKGMRATGFNAVNTGMRVNLVTTDAPGGRIVSQGNIKSMDLTTIVNVAMVTLVMVSTVTEITKIHVQTAITSVPPTPCVNTMISTRLILLDTPQ